MNKLPKIPKGKKIDYYIVTEYGKIFSLLNFRYLKPINGQVYLKTKEGVKREYVHRLTARLFVPNPNPNELTEVVKINDTGHYTGLRWVAHKAIKRAKRPTSLQNR